MSIEDPPRPESEFPAGSDHPDPDRPVEGDQTEYIEKGVKDGEIEQLEERDE
jgi:hypothetical protein